MTVARLLGSGFPPIGGVTVLRALLGLVISAAAWGQTGTAITTFGPNNSFSPNSWCVSGANTSDCGPAVDRYIAAPFTPSSALTVSSIILPLGYYSGTNGAVIALTIDSSGTPGAVLESWVVQNLPSAGPSPALTSLVSTLNPVLQVAQTYWVEVLPLAPDTLDFWYTNDQGLGGGFTSISVAGWTALNGYAGQTLPAFAVNGTSALAQASVIGRVVWNGTPVPNSVVQLKQSGGNYNSLPVLASTVSAADGTFTIPSPPTGSLTIYALAPSTAYWPGAGDPVTIVSGQQTNVGDLTIYKIMQLIAPTNSATITTATPTLEWTAFPGAALYQVSVYDNTTSQQVFFQSTQYTQITVSPALQTGRQYGWGVYAYNASGQEIAYYAFWYFTVSGALTVTCIPQSGTYTPGAQYSTTCTASGGTSPYNWSFSNLPSWLTSSATPPYTSIMLSGTVPNPPPYSYAVGVTVADSTFPTGNTGTTTVTINLGVDQLGGNPVSLSNGAGSGKVTTTSTVSNSGSVSTTFTLSSSTVSGGNWLSASAPTNTIPAGGSVDITITADTTQLQPGSYNGTVRVTGTYSTALISVALAVSGVQISASPNPIALGSITPQKQPAATVTVSSTGGTAVVAIGVAIQQGQGSGWLSTDTAQITTNATFHVTVDASSLAPGSYEEFITLQCTAAPCIEVEVPVTFTVVSGPAAPTITAVQNNYSRILPGAPNYGIAPGTLFIVKGTGLADPDSPVVLQDPSKALPQTLYGASASVTVNGVTVKPALYYALDYQLALVLPSNTPVGTGTITVSYEGQPSQPAQLQIVASAFGFGAYDGTLAIATDNADGHLITTNQSAQPGEIIVFWGSGDGADTNNDDVNPPKHFDNLSGTTALYFGGVPVPILYQGRSPYQGVDQVAVTVPFPCTAPDTPAGCTVNPPTGCAVSVVAVIGSGSGASVSNLVTMPIATNGGTCVDPLSYVNPSEIATLANKTTANFGRLSVAQQKSLTGTTETAAASFYSIGGSLLSGYQSTYQPSLGSCFVTQSNSEMPANPFTLSGLDAGTLSVTGPGGTEALSGTQGSPGIYDAQLPSGFVPAAGGTFTFTGTGGADVGPVSAGLSFPSPLIWINSSSDGTVSRTQGVTVDWTGGAPGSFVQISGYSSSQGFSAFFVCDAPASAQSFTVPDSVLLALPAGSGTLAVSTYTNPVGFTAVGLDFGFAMAYASTSINATYQ